MIFLQLFFSASAEETHLGSGSVKHECDWALFGIRSQKPKVFWEINDGLSEWMNGLFGAGKHFLSAAALWLQLNFNIILLGQ